MTLPMVRAVIKGYSDRVFDMQVAAVMSGYYSGYYMSKKPKQLQVILNDMYKRHYGRLQLSGSESTHASQGSIEDKVAQFQRREERLRRFLNAQ